MKLRFVVCASCSSNGSDARFVLKTVVVCINKMVVLPSRFLSPEGIAECERACNKEKPSLQELSKAALNVSIGKRVEWRKYVHCEVVDEFFCSLGCWIVFKLSSPGQYNAVLKRRILLVVEAVGHCSLNMNILKFNALESRLVMGYPTIILVSLNWFPDEVYFHLAPILFGNRTALRTSICAIYWTKLGSDRIKKCRELPILPCIKFLHCTMCTVIRYKAICGQ